MQQPTRLISTPFAQEGEKTEIQNVTGEFDNSATYRLGFPPLTMQSIRLGGKPPKGTDFNGVLFDITENISFLCKGGRYQYNAGLSTLIGGYPKGSNLLLDDNVTEVVSTVAGNQNNPNTDMTGWILKPNKTTAVNVADASGETQQQVNYNGGSKWHSRVGGYLENERVVLVNGDIVKSTVNGNVNDPSLDLNGWDNESEKLRYSLTKTNNLLDYFTRQEKSDYIANPSTYDATAIVIRALADADILDCRKLPVGISTSVVVREGCQCLNANFFNLNVVDASILVNTSSRVTGKVTGSGAGLATVERAVMAANDSVSGVYLDLEITNLTVGVQVSGSNALVNECSGWHGVLRFKNLTGGGTNSTGYGVLLPRAKNCEFLVYADNVPRHDVYLSAGATGNTILCYSKNSKGSPLSIASYANQDVNTDNNVTMHIENCTPQSSSSPYAAVITGRSQKNNIYLYGQSSPLLDGAIVFRSLASDAVCHGNYAYLNWTGGSSGVLAFNQSSFNNDFDIVGDGGCVNANVSLISANTYQSITTFTEGTPKYTARLRSFKWDGVKLAAGHVAYAYAVGQFTGIANFDIGEGILKGANGFATKKVRVDLGAIIGSTHRERIVTTGVSVPANGAQDFTVNYSEAYGNVSIPVASLVAPSAGVNNSVELAITSRSNSTVTFKAINKATIAQTMFIVGEVSGY